VSPVRFNRSTGPSPPCSTDGPASGWAVVRLTPIFLISSTGSLCHVLLQETALHPIGPVESNHLLELQPKALIQGDVRYESLEMHQGATIEGALQRLTQASAAALEDKPALKLLAAGNDKK
jgi:hypothetical protein